MAKKLQLRRGTTSQHSSFTGAVGEVTVDTDKKVVVVHDGSTAGGVPLAKAADVVAVIDEDNFSSDTATQAPSQQSTKAYIAATSQPLDADLTSLAGCQTGAAAALALLTSTEVGVLDGATLTTTELNYVDGVTSSIQTQLNAKGVGDAVLANDQNWTGAQRGAITSLTSAASITIDFAASNNFSLTTGHAAIAFANPTTEVAGQAGSIFITQGSTGCTAPTWGNQWLFAGGTAPTLTSGENKIDRIDYIVQEAGKIHVVAHLNLGATS